MTFKFEDINILSTILGTIALSVISVVLLLCKSLYDRRRIFKFSKKLKGYTFYPIIGNGYHVMGKNIFTALQEIIQKFGTPCNAWFGHDYNYLTDDASEIKIILNHPNSFDKNTAYDNFKLVFEKSLILAPFEVWKQHRKFYAKSFSQPILNTFVQYYYEKSCVLLDLLKESENKDKFEMFEKYTFDSFCASIIGVDYNLQVKPQNQMVEIIGELQRLVGNRLTSSYYFNEKIWFYTSEGKRVVHRVNALKKIVYEILEEKRNEFKEKEAELLVTDNKMLPLLDSMLKSDKEGFDDDLIFRETLLFAAAATDTSGYTLAYIFTLLGMNLEVQEKVYQEVIRTVGHDRQICHYDLPNLKYTERAILEAMRILPVTPYLGRLATGDVELGTRIIPKGANIIICVFNLHRNEKYWSDPLKYNPDRFLPDEIAKRHPYAFVPFSAGARNCIGKTYAMMLMKTCVANVIRHYEVFSKYKSVTELKLVSCITMKTEDDLDCRFKLRKHK